MDSKEAMRVACKEVGVKNVAAAIEVSPTGLYNQINDQERNDILNKFVDFNNACENDIAIRWACEELNGIFITNPDLKIKAERSPDDFIPNSLKEFSDVIREILEANKDGKISKEEALKIRKEWEELKTELETFVLTCEFGYNE